MSTERHSIVGLARQLGLDAELLLALAGEPGVHYRAFTLRRAGKKPREIDNPDAALKLVQRRIRKVLLAPLPLPAHVHGCVKGQSPLTNAKVHCGSAAVASVDVKDFYPSVSHRTVFLLWRRLGFGERLASILTKLTTRDFHLPQGAPTSDALANHVMRPVDERLTLIARDFGLKVTRYLDNIDLSGERSREAIPQVVAALRENGFAVRHKKVFNTARDERQTVTGHTVNSGMGPSVARMDQRRIRSAVHEVIRRRRNGTSTGIMERRLRGRLAYLRQTNSGAADRLDRQLRAAGITLR